MSTQRPPLRDVGRPREPRGYASTCEAGDQRVAVTFEMCTISSRLVLLTAPLMHSALASLAAGGFLGFLWHHRLLAGGITGCWWHHRLPE